MSRARKIMISVRLPVSLVGRLDYVVRNTDVERATRSSEIQAAIESWLASCERRFRELGLDPPK
jgi:metal-responsive CopG/Arc/MetJ family transcriptional regulator